VPRRTVDGVSVAPRRLTSTSAPGRSTATPPALGRPAGHHASPPRRRTSGRSSTAAARQLAGPVPYSRLPAPTRPAAHQVGRNKSQTGSTCERLEDPTRQSWPARQSPRPFAKDPPEHTSSASPADRPGAAREHKSAGPHEKRPPPATTTNAERHAVHHTGDPNHLKPPNLATPQSRAASRLAPVAASLSAPSNRPRPGAAFRELAPAVATERKPPARAAEFRFDPIVSPQSANTRRDACPVSARRRAL